MLRLQLKLLGILVEVHFMHLVCVVFACDKVLKLGQQRQKNPSNFGLTDSSFEPPN